MARPAPAIHGFSFVFGGGPPFRISATSSRTSREAALIRDPCHHGSEALPQLERAEGEAAAQRSLRRHGVDRRVKPGDDG
jgi:hypothetical protein